jgi:Flp pilus assembly protein TadD
VTGPDQRNARAALDVARLSVAQLDASRGAEDLAADLIDVWSALEAALRALVGSTVLSGQPLIREARQRQLINFDQANALADFSAVHDRVQDTAYHPTPADLESARAAFTKLDTGALGDAGTATSFSGSPTAPPMAPPPTYDQPAAVSAAPMLESTVVGSGPRRRSLPMWATAAIGVVVIALIGGGLYFAMAGRGTSSSLQQGVTAYHAGQREAAVSAFNKAVREDPKASLPHVYLARMAREVGNFTVANQELQLALQIDPSDPVALREMGADLFAQGNFELARRFYVRAVQTDPSDKSALGYLGCTLVKLGRTAEAANFLTRAGSGAWSACAQASPPTGTPAPSRTR